MSTCDVVLVMSPYGYAYSVPYQLGYLKSALQKEEISTKCLDFNIGFYHEFELIEESFEITKVSNKYAEKSKYIDVVNWQDRERYHDTLHNDLCDYVKDCAQKILQYNPQVVGFSVFNTNLWFSIQLIRQLKEMCKNLSIVIGGPDCTISYNRNSTHVYDELFSKKLLEAAIVGEGERTIVELCRRLIDGEDYHNIAGVVTSSFLGKSKIKRKRDYIEDLSAIDFPDYSDFLLKDYTRNVLPLSFSRGCNFHCTFCEIETLWENCFRKRTAQDIADEISYLAKYEEFGYLFLNGSYVNVSGKLMDELTTILIERWGDTPRFQWNGWAKIHKNLSLERLQKLKKSGCYELVFGLESGSQKVVNDMNKSFNVEVASGVLRDTKMAGIDVTVFIIVGYPTETEKDFQETLKFLSQNREYIKAAYCMSECILSEKMLANPQKYGVKKKNLDAFKWESQDGLTYPMRQDRLRRFYQHLEKIGLKSS